MSIEYTVHTSGTPGSEYDFVMKMAEKYGYDAEEDEETQEEPLMNRISKWFKGLFA